MSDPQSHFRALYADNPDPWNYETSAYEARKYRATLDALMQPRYGTILEAGCSIGVLSAQLAQRCAHLIAIDFAEAAVVLARERLRNFAGATVLRATLPEGWPPGRYDLVVLSELIYYLPADSIVALAGYVARDTVRFGECVLVHYQGDTQTDITPDAARDLFCATLGDCRQMVMVDHVTTGEYNHRTLRFDEAE